MGLGDLGDFCSCTLKSLLVEVSEQSIKMQMSLNAQRASGTALRSLSVPDAARPRVTLKFAAQQPVRTVCKVAIAAPVRRIPSV